MAGASAVFEDNSLLSRLDRNLLKLETFFALLSGLAVFSLMFLAAYSVGGRKFFASPLSGYVDYIEVLMPLIAVMGIAFVQRDGSHIRMDMVIGQLRGRPLWAAELLSVTLILLLMIALTMGAWAHFERSFDCARPLCSRDSSIDIGLPIWPSKLIVPLAFGVMCLRLALQVWGYARAFVLNIPNPVAVPLVQSIEEQARAEVDQLGGSDNG